MSYRMIYEPGSPGREGICVLFRILMSASFFVLFLWTVNRFWPEGRELLKLLLIPGDPDATLEAAEAFANNLGAGEHLTAAWHRFVSAAIGTDAAA
jgi:hypothetical protein